MFRCSFCKNITEHIILSREKTKKDVQFVVARCKICGHVKNRIIKKGGKDGKE